MNVHRLRIVIRADLAPGLQAAQAVHGAIAWAVEHLDICRSWMASSNTVALLAAPS